MDNRFLLIDCCGYTTLNLTESANGQMRFQGKFQQANCINKNKRMYTFEVLSKNVDQLTEAIEARGLYGELDHPETSIIHLSNASHVVTKLWWDSNILMGEAEILPTPSGMILKKLIESGCRVGISSRGVGNGQTNSEGVLIIDQNFKLVTFDLVADPSTYAAFQTKVTGKREHFEKPFVESTNKINHRTLVSYVGTMLDTKLKEIKNKMRNLN